MRITILLTLALFFTFTVFARKKSVRNSMAIKQRNQEKFIEGKVIDSLTLEPIEFATITDLNNKNSIHTNKNGAFRLKINTGDSLAITFIGYQPKIIKADQHSVFAALKKGTIALKDIVITNSPTLNTYKTLTNLDLNMQPAKSAQDLLRLVPGLFIAQHQGGGKAEQIFLRGFDADHGTDVNISVDGIPVNMVSQAHGQGYADLHFLIPETVAGYDFGKGPYYTDKGDFNTAGYVAYNTKNVLDRDMVKVEAGQFNTLRTVALINLLDDDMKKRGTSAYVAADYLYSNGGPFSIPEHFNRLNLFGKFITRLDSNNTLTAIASTFKSDWRASGETPDRAVAEGYIANRFGTLDSAQGGHTARTNLSLKLVSNLGNGWSMTNQLWYSHYYFNLISNFSFYYYFPQTGDEFRQYERRDMGGYNGSLSKSVTVNNTTFTTTAGTSSRYDHIDPLELDHTENGQFLGYLQYGRAKELNVNGYIDETATTGKWLFNAGVRLDYFHYFYQNLATDTLATNIFNNVSQNAAKAIISPKINIEYIFNNQLQLYLKAGKGFHSNDARVVIAHSDAEVLPAAYGTDLGLNWKPLPGLFINTAAWYMYLQQEFTFGSDLIDQPAGPVSPSGRTVRIGVDLSARYQLTKWLFTNLNVNVARPRYLDSLKGHDYVSLAPTFTSTAGLDFRFKNGINGGISYRYLHSRAANSDYSLTARGYFITDLTVNYTRKKYEVGIAIENLFNRNWDEAQFEYTSLLKGETKPVDEISYTPGTPLFAKLKFTVFF